MKRNITKIEMQIFDFNHNFSSDLQEIDKSLATKILDIIDNYINNPSIYDKVIDEVNITFLKSYSLYSLFQSSGLVLYIKITH